MVSVCWNIIENRLVGMKCRGVMRHREAPFCTKRTNI